MHAIMHHLCDLQVIVNDGHWFRFFQDLPMYERVHINYESESITNAINAFYVCLFKFAIILYLKMRFRGSILSISRNNRSQTIISASMISALQWCHNERDDVSNHQLHNCLLKRVFSRRSKKTSKLRVTGLCEWNSPVPGEFPAQGASNAKKNFIWWRHHGILKFKRVWNFYVSRCAHTLNSLYLKITYQCSSYTPCMYQGKYQPGSLSRWPLWR